MKTVLIVGAVVIVLGLGYWWYTKNQQTPNAVAAATGSTPGTQGSSFAHSITTAISNRNPQALAPLTASSLKPSNFIEQHVERKDALAPAVLGKFGVPSSISQPIASVASKLDVSGYAENYIGSHVGGLLNKIGL